ncbi:MAG: hypothetical protein U0270_12910 [Labilithrix sp.]
MADNAGKPGDPPTSGDSARQSVRSYDRSTLSRPPPARRDPRADPDDEPISERVDVVTMDRGSGGGDRSSTIDSLTNAALTLRRELAKLHQQAAAVERTIEDQRRERSDAIERAEIVNARVTELEQRAESAEAEVANLKKLHDQVKAERDDLARSLDQAKATAEDLQRAREELATMRREKEEIVRAAATFENELGEIRKREQLGAQKATDTEAELQAVRERFERTSAELLSAREEVTAARAETVKFRQEASEAAEIAAQKLSESEHERLAAKEQISRLEQTLAEGKIIQDKVLSLDAALTNARMELVNGRSEIGRLERDLEDVRQARDVATERALMAEKDRDDARKEIERLQPALEAANQSAANASARATAADRARVASEESVRALRDEITTAFARWRSATPSVAPPPNSVAPPTRAVPLSEIGQIPGTAPLPREVSGAPEPMKVTPSSAQTAPPSAHVPVPAGAPPPSVAVSGPPPPPAPPPEPETRPVLDDDWTSPSNPPPRPNSVPPPSGSIRASKAPSQSKLPSVAPPPASASLRASKAPSSVRLQSAPPAAPVPESTKSPAASIPPIHPRSVPPAPPPRSVAPPVRSVPPPLPARAQSIPPAVYPSVPPPGPLAPLPAQSTSPTAPPPRPEESSVVTYVSQERANYIELLGSPKTSREAAAALREHPDWLRGRPPIELLLALTLLDYDIEEPVFGARPRVGSRAALAVRSSRRCETSPSRSCASTRHGCSSISARPPPGPRSPSS